MLLEDLDNRRMMQRVYCVEIDDHGLTTREESGGKNGNMRLKRRISRWKRVHGERGMGTNKSCEAVKREGLVEELIEVSQATAVCVEGGCCRDGVPV